MKSKKKKSIEAEGKKVYRFQLIDIHTYDVKWVMELTKGNLFMLTTSVIGIFLVFAFLVFALTPLKYLLPGYVGTNAQQKKEIIELKLKTDSLENNVNIFSRYYTDWEKFMKDSIPIHLDRLASDSIAVSDREAQFPERGKLEAKYHKDFELLYELDDKSKVSENALILSQLSSPFEGKVATAGNNNINSKDLRIKVIPDSDVHAIYDGVIISKIVIKKRVVFYIQHTNGFVSIYRFYGEALVKKNEKVEKGQLIGVIDKDDKEQIATFELWSDGGQIAAGKYLDY
ncbi:MAG: M23 family metallopeptidase [Chitinophagales bacterium]|nr:M23 family metallopeptidase [Chitinophagales bacterium]